MTAASAKVKATASKTAAVVKKVTPPESGIRVGIVQSVPSDTKVVVNISGSVLTLPYLSSYVPVVGDNAQVLKMNDTWVVIGTVTPNHGVLLGEAGQHTYVLTATLVTAIDVTIPFMSPFPSAPAVVANIDSAVGNLRQWITKALNRTPTQFLLRIESTDSTTINNATTPTVNVQWIATAPITNLG